MAAKEDKFTWRIEKFSTLRVAEIRSPTFSLKGHKWKIRFATPHTVNWLGAYVEFADSDKRARELSLAADFCLTLVNQLNRTSSFEITFEEGFNMWNKSSSRYWFDLSMSDCKGFFVDDTLVLEAQIRKSRKATLFSELSMLRTVLNEESGLKTESDYIAGYFTLKEMSEKVPRTKAQLLKIDGIGPCRLSKYGDRLLQTIESTIKEYYREDESGSQGNNISDSSKNTTTEPPDAIVDLSTEPLSMKNQELGISKDAGDPEVIELDAYDQFGRDSASPPLSNKVARSSTVRSPCSSNVRSASKNLIAELSTMANTWKHTPVYDANMSTNDANHGSALLLQEQRRKLVEFLEMSLEEICVASLFDKVSEVVLKISDLATDPFEKRVLKDLLSRLVEFRSITPKSMSIVESPPMVETSSPAETRKQLEGSLVQRQNQLTFLDAKALRIEEEKMKVEAEIQQLVARKDKLVREENSVLAELEVANREASSELERLKRKQREHEQARENQLRAKERLAKNNVSWKLFKDNLGL
ncbi:ATP-dependent DNA helicase Q-like 4B [Linum perenne]